MTDIAEQLRAAALFQNLDTETLAAIAECAQYRQVERDKLLFQAGDAFQSFFLVVDGHIQLSRLAPSGHEKVVEIIGPEETFAEAVLFMEGRRYPVDARALEAAQLLAIDADCFNRLLDARRGLARNLLGALSKRLHRLVQDVAALTLEDASGRVVGYLLGQIPEGEEADAEIHLPAKKAAIASRLGIQPETFSRILSRLRETGAIEVAGDTIRILEPDKLYHNPG
ncbi:Crp/Fnr family transcriptional regulator [Thiohalorhabdus sp.]|uniref:Crp/Fnr family transcriptional regulator n=1 Tax=Thiohalorhabdus sp. TaxID=3094134 RepID=UPI002FC38C16